MTESSNNTTQPEVSILIVGYNTKELVADCLRGLYEHTVGVEFEVLYVDCSDDGSVQMLARDFPQVRVIENNQNLGFGRGNNLLARHAKGKRLLLLNPDTIISDNAIGELNALADSEPDAGAWGGMTVLPDGRVDPGCKQPGPGLKYLVYRMVGLRSASEAGLSKNADMPQEVPVLTGAFMMVRRDVWQQLKGFDESFFMYCEETELCLRIWQSGNRILMTPKSRITHLVGSGSSDSPTRMLAMTKGNRQMARKHFGTLHNLCDGVLRWLYSLTRYLAGIILVPIKPDKARRMRGKHRLVVFRLQDWWSGWENTPQSQNSEVSTASETTKPVSSRGDAA